MIQSLIAVSTGGVTGLGLMEGKQKLFYLPEPHTDFIFAVTAEELGLVGALAVIILFAIFLWRGTRAALRTQDNFGRFLAVGITSMIVAASLHQHQRCPRPDAHQRHSAAIRFLRRLVAVRDPGLRRRAAEHHQAGRITDRLQTSNTTPPTSDVRRAYPEV